MQINEIIRLGKVIPVIEISRIEDAAPLARIFQEAGVRVTELTLRTPCALDAVAEMQAVAPDLVIGMGTIRTQRDIARSIEAGARFLVSPGASPSLLDALSRSGVACLPGVATASEAMSAVEAGFQCLKFFPAEAAGGAAYLKSLAGPLPDVSFCPTGGVSLERAPQYLALENVPCVGGTWVAPKHIIEAGDWNTLAANAALAKDFG